MYELPVSSSGDQSFALSVHRRNARQAVLAASGELDVAAAADLSDLVRAHELAGRFLVRIDLSGVTFIDCSCLRVLLDAHHRLLALPARLVLSPVSTPVAALIKATHLDKTLLVVEGASAPTGLAPTGDDGARRAPSGARARSGSDA